MEILTAIAAFGYGIVVGLLLDYLVEGRYLQKRVEELTDIIVHMRKQGFVPQFEIEQKSEIDLTLPEH